MGTQGCGGRLAASGLVALLACAPAALRATGPVTEPVPTGDDGGAIPASDAHIRTTDRALKDALADGVAHSATFEALVAHLEASDVVVFLAYDRRPGKNLASRISFVSAAGGRRYLMIGLLTKLPRIRQVSILAHELQHAVEIADAPSVKDAPSMARYYADLKYGGVVDPSLQHRFESRAAINAENQVAREMRPVVRNGF